MKRSSLRRESIGRVVALLELRQGDVSADEAVEIVGCRGRQFRRLFQQIVGTSFRDAQLQARLKPARPFVFSRECSIPRIAGRFGYQRRAKFDQSYERAFGVTPARDRRLARTRLEMATQGVDSFAVPE